MPRTAHRRSIPQRKRLFIAVEGEGEQAFCKWLQQLCDARANVHLHLDVNNMRGGDPLKMVEKALKRREHNRELARVEYVESLLLLDADRLIEGEPRCSRAIQLAQSKRLRLIVQYPNQEGVLLRLHAGYEDRFPLAERVTSDLRAVWTEYEKPVEFRALERRFDESCLQVAARHDPDLKNLLAILGLLWPGLDR